MWDPYAEFETAVLPNGLTVHAAHWPGRPWEAMGFLIHSGAEQDPIGLEGAAHFVEHLVLNNAPVSRQEVSDFFKSTGGSVHLGETSWAYTKLGFWVPLSSGSIEKALWIFGAALLQARLVQRFGIQKKVILGEFREDFPHKLKRDFAEWESQALFVGYPQGRTPNLLGYPKSIRKISREDLQEYYDRHYTPANIELVGVGGLSLGEMLAHLSGSPFAIRKEGERTVLPSPLSEVGLPRVRRRVVVLSRRLRTTSFKVGGYRSVALIPTGGPTAAISILTKMLGECLFEKVREQLGATYSISANFTDYFRFYKLAIECGNLEPRWIERVESIVEDSLMKMYDDRDLFEKHKQFLMSSIRMSDPNARGVCNSAVGNLAYRGRILSLAEDFHEVEIVTFDQVRKLLNWLSPGRRYTLITKP